MDHGSLEIDLDYIRMSLLFFYVSLRFSFLSSPHISLTLPCRAISLAHEDPWCQLAWPTIHGPSIGSS